MQKPRCFFILHHEQQDTEPCANRKCGGKPGGYQPLKRKVKANTSDKAWMRKK